MTVIRSEVVSDTPTALTRRKEWALSALLGGQTVAEAARTSGVSRATLHRWLAGDPHFVAELHRLRLERREAMRQALEGLGDLAVATLRGLLLDPATPPGVRLRAACVVLEASLAAPVGPSSPRDARVEMARAERGRLLREMLHGVPDESECGRPLEGRDGEPPAPAPGLEARQGRLDRFLREAGAEPGGAAGMPVALPCLS
jgi:hypothetical protein